MKKKLFFTGLLAVCLTLAACDRDAAHPGEVALVNGTPITLKQLQAAHDSLVLSGDNPGRSVDILRREYGAALSDLIVQELVVQELAQKKISVTDRELEEAEADLLRDFPPGGFERMLLEESIDADMWRSFLYRQLSMLKFNNQVLRPRVAITADEVEEYYLMHQDDFMLPERLNFVQFSGLIKDQTVSASEQFRKTRDAAGIQARFPQISIRMVVMREDRLAPDIVKELAKLKSGQTTPPMELNGEFATMVLLGREKPRQLSREEMYSRIESIILEDKIQSAFQDWLEKRVEKSTIKVSVHLIPETLR